MIRTNATSFQKMRLSYVREVREMSDKAAQASAKAMERHMRRIAPRRTGLLISTIEAVQTTDGWMVVSGGPRTQRRIGSRTYDRVVEVGAGKSGRGAKKKAGGSSVVFDYALGVEVGTNKRRPDPYHRPARVKARKAHRSRIRRGINKIAKKHSG